MRGSESRADRGTPGRGSHQAVDEGGDRRGGGQAELVAHGVPVDTFKATFDDGVTLLDEAGEEDLWRERSNVTVGALGLQELGHEAAIASTADCAAALLLMTTGGFDRIVGFARDPRG